MSKLETKLELNRVYQGHTLEVLKTFPNNYFSLIVTSPPYWGLRNYDGEAIIWDGIEDCEHNFDIEVSKGGRIKREQDLDPKQTKIKENQFVDKPSNFCIKCNAWRGQLGLEPDFNMYIDHLIQIFDECKRILRKDGALWVNLGDTYSSKGGISKPHVGATAKVGATKAGIQRDIRNITNKIDIKDKSLVGIPARFQIAMIDRGWILRNEVIWHKPNAMPSSVKDRFSVDFEKLFFFVKNRKYYFEQQFEPLDIKENEYRKELRKDKIYNVKSKHSQSMWSKGSKYKDGTTEKLHRQGMNKERGQMMIKKRNLPDQKDFVDWLRNLKNYLKRDADLFGYSLQSIIKWISEDLQIKETTIEHWFRYDESGFAFPSIDDWLKFQDIYNTDKFNELVEYWEEPDTIKSYSKKLQNAYKGNAPTNYYRMGDTKLKMNYSNQDGHSGYYDKDVNFRANVLGRNKRAVWSINTKPFPKAHFAVFPEELIEPIIKSCCPKEICIECNKPRNKIYGDERINTRPGINIGKGKSGTKIDPNKELHNSDLTKYRQKIVRWEIGNSSCDCNAEFRSGVMLDIFMGAGTTGVVAKKEKINWVGIELNPEYVEMAIERIKEVAVYHSLEEWF